MFRKIAGMNWVATTLLPLMTLLMELMWVAPWLMLMGRWPIFLQQREPLGLASVVLLLGSSFALTRISINRKWPLRRARAVIVGCGLLAVLIVIRFEYTDGSSLFDAQWFVHFGSLLVSSFSRPNEMVLGLVIALYLWWRGIAVGRSALFFESIYRSFSVGVAALIGLILAWGHDPRGSFMSVAGPFLAGFFFCGLASLALARLQSMERKKDTDTRAAFNGRWLSIIIVVTAAIVVIGIGATSIFSSDSVPVLGKVFGFLTGILFKIVFFATAIVAYFVAATMYIVMFIINALVQKPPPNEPQVSGNLTAIETIKQGANRTLSPQVLQAVEWGVFLLAAAGGLILLARAFMRYRRPKPEDDVEEIHESLWSREGLWSDVRLFFRILWQKLTGKVRQVIPHGSSQETSRILDANDNLSIREIYQRLLWDAAQVGVTRRVQETPSEYEKRLAQTVPEGEGPLDELTDMYIEVRYGEMPSEETKVKSANGLWRTMQRVLRRTETEQAG